MKSFITLLFSLFLISIAVAQDAMPKTGETILGAHYYFPDEIGLTWTYSGTTVDQIRRVADYTNTAKVIGVEKKEGAEVRVFSESNPYGRGPTKSYFKKDKMGIMYWGGDPSSDFENQLIPYRVLPFPIVLGQSYTQIEKQGIPYDQDLDNDGINEQADIFSTITAIRFETVSTPAGEFRNAIQFQGKMMIWITLSREEKTVVLVSKGTNWFAPGIGLVKGIEQLEFPAIDGKDSSVVITTEVLKTFSGKKPPV